MSDQATTVTWTEDRVETMKKLWKDGLSASHIAGAIGGVTRNAVIGKVHRLGLQHRVVQRQYHKKKSARPAAPRVPREGPPTKPIRAHITVDTYVVPDHARQNLADMDDVTDRNRCRFIYGDPCTPEHHFCDQKKCSGTSYCAHHASLCFVSTRPSRSSRRPLYQSIAAPSRGHYARARAPQPTIFDKELA